MHLKVAEFHRTFGVYSSDTPTLPPELIRKLRIAILTEEYKEYLTADDENDLVEIADALADMAYLICGTAITYGIGRTEPYMPLFSDVPDGTKARFPSAGLRKMLREGLGRDFNDYLAAEIANDLKMIETALTLMLERIAGISYCFGIPLIKIFNEVHRSNMTKLMPDGTVRRREDGKVLKGPNWEPPNIENIIFPNGR